MTRRLIIAQQNKRCNYMCGSRGKCHLTLYLLKCFHREWRRLMIFHWSIDTENYSRESWKILGWLSSDTWTAGTELLNRSSQRTRRSGKAGQHLHAYTVPLNGGEGFTCGVPAVEENPWRRSMRGGSVNRKPTISMSKSRVVHCSISWWRWCLPSTQFWQLPATRLGLRFRSTGGT